MFFLVSHNTAPPVYVNDLLARLRVPLLLLWGDRDPWVTPARVSCLVSGLVDRVTYMYPKHASGLWGTVTCSVGHAGTGRLPPAAPARLPPGSRQAMHACGLWGIRVSCVTPAGMSAQRDNREQQAGRRHGDPNSWAVPVQSLFSCV